MKIWPSDWEPPYDPDRLSDDILDALRELSGDQVERILWSKTEMWNFVRKLGYQRDDLIDRPVKQLPPGFEDWEDDLLQD